MSEPTKGPYRLGSPTYLDAEIELWCATIYDCGANPVGCGYGSSKEQAEATAHLLAAAWEMREALQFAEGHLEEERQNPITHPIADCPVLNGVRAALAKADGKETKNEHAK